MSERDVVEDAAERLDWADAKEDEGTTRASMLRSFTRRTALMGGGGGTTPNHLEACG